MKLRRDAPLLLHRLFVILLISIYGNAGFAQEENRRRDTLLLADPHVFFFDDVYYVYGTGSVNQGFSVYTSRNLKEWEGPAGVSDGLALKKGDAYGAGRFWAPQVFLYDGTFYMAYTADEHIAIARSNSPLGPFVQDKLGALPAPVKQIDPFVFIDDDGRKYLYHVRVADGGNRIFVAELNDDFSGIKPETLKLCITATESWETSVKDRWRVTEGPTVLKHKGLYYLIYSANHFRTPDYAVGYAVSKSPLGPWKKFQGNPILSKENIGVNGTGHGDVFRNSKGEMFYVFHTHHSDHAVSPRKTALVKIGFVEDHGDSADNLDIAETTFHFLTRK